MAGWRFWARRPSTNPFAGDQPPPTVEDAAVEGIAMAEQAAVMSLKNRILVLAHTQRDEFDVDEYLPAAREVLEELACEADDVAERTRADRKAAARLRGRSVHQHDYRQHDLENLTVRERSFEAVAAGLRAMQTDPIGLRELVIAARDRAWSELAREMERSLDSAELREFGDADYEVNRDARLREFLTVDLFRLQMQAQRRERTDSSPESDDPEY